MQLEPMKKVKQSGRERVREELAELLTPPVNFTLHIEQGELKTVIVEQASNRHELREALNRIGRVVDGIAPRKGFPGLEIAQRQVTLAGIQYASMTYWHDALLMTVRTRPPAVVEIHFQRGSPNEIQVYHQGRYLCTAHLVHRMAEG